MFCPIRKPNQGCQVVTISYICHIHLLAYNSGSRFANCSFVWSWLRPIQWPWQTDAFRALEREREVECWTNVRYALVIQGLFGSISIGSILIQRLCDPVRVHITSQSIFCWTPYVISIFSCSCYPLLAVTWYVAPRKTAFPHSTASLASRPFPSPSRSPLPLCSFPLSPPRIRFYSPLQLCWSINQLGFNLVTCTPPAISIIVV